MIYPQKFQSLIDRIMQTQDSNLKFVGQGIPGSLFLFVGKECSINRDTTRGQGCYEMEYEHNAQQWAKNIENDTQPYEVPDWVKSPIGEESYNPLLPYYGLLNKKAERLADGSSTNNGVSASWCAYQKLFDTICKTGSSPIINFHRNTFATEFSDVKTDYNSLTNAKAQESINIRCSQLLNDSFFRSFPVTIVDCGRFVKDYHINLEDVFDQTFVSKVETPKGWYRIYKKYDRLLIHTSPLAHCSDEIIKEIAELIYDFLTKPLLKFCLYYDGSEPPKGSTEGLYAFYEQHWINDYFYKYPYEGDIIEMKSSGITDEWLNKFGIPHSLIALFFNRYFHWSSPYAKIEDFQSWFEGVRKMNK